MTEEICHERQFQLTKEEIFKKLNGLSKEDYEYHKSTRLDKMAKGLEAMSKRFRTYDARLRKVGKELTQ